MSLSTFFGVVSTVDFALLGLWWVTVQARADLRRHHAAGSRMAYVVSLQFILPGTASLLAQVDPAVTAVWRVSFALAGVTGIAAIVLLVPALAASGELCLVVFLSTQVAWAAAMSTDPAAKTDASDGRRDHPPGPAPRSR